MWGNKASKPLAVTTMGVEVAGETASLPGESAGEGPQGPRTYKSPPPGNQHQGSTRKGTIHLWEIGEVTESRWELSRQHCSLWPLPHIQQRRLPHPGEYLRLLPLQCNRCAKTKKYGPNERTDQNSRKRTKWQEDNKLSDAEFKTFVIRLLTEMIEFSHKMKEEMKAIQSKIKKNIQWTHSEGKETRILINDLEQKEEINIQPEHNEETRIQKNEERLRNLWDNFERYSILIIGVPEEEEEQEIKNLLEKKRRKTSPIWWRKQTCKSRKLRDSQRIWTQRGTHQNTS